MPINYTQELCFETDDPTALREVLSAAGPILFGRVDLEQLTLHPGAPHRLKALHPSFAAQMGLRRAPAETADLYRQGHLLLYWPVCSIKAASGEASAREERRTYSSWAALAGAAVELAQAADLSGFVHQTVAGRVFNATEGPFGGLDGGVAIGFRAYYSPWLSLYELFIGRCHVYYPQ